MSTVSDKDFNEVYGGDLERLARAFNSARAIYTYRESWGQTLCYKVLNAKEEEEKFLMEPLAEKKRVWP
jgi:hypothetical protein